MAFQSPLKLPRVAVKKAIMLPKERTYVVGHLAESPTRTWYSHSWGKDLDAKAEWTKYRLVLETDATPLYIISSRFEFLLTWFLHSPFPMVSLGSTYDIFHLKQPLSRKEQSPPDQFLIH